MTIFAFLMLNTPRSAHEEIFGAKFLSFGGVAISGLHTVCYVISAFLRTDMEVLKRLFQVVKEPL